MNPSLGPVASATSAIALGSADVGSSLAGASASGVRSIAIGAAASTSGVSALAIGVAASATGNSSISIGNVGNTASASSATQFSSIAIGSGGNTGTGAQSTGAASLAIGSGDGNNSGATASAESAIAIGPGSAPNNLPGAVASALRSIALGTGASNSGISALAIGVGAIATGNSSISIGNVDNGQQLGSASNATQFGSIAIGSGGASTPGPQSTGASSLAIGSADGNNAGAIASAEGATAIGPAFNGVANGAVAGGLRSVAIGTGASVSQNDAIVLGNVGTNAVSIGIGTNTPSAKLTISGTGFGGVTPLQLVTPPASNPSDFLLTIDNSGNVRQSSATQLFGSLSFSGASGASGSFVINGGQAGPVTIGTTNTTTLAFITNNVNRLTIDQTGNSTFTGNIKLPAATRNVSTSNAAGATSGLLELGGPNPSSTNVSMFEIGTRNFFAGNYATVPPVTTASDNIAIGQSALSALTTGANNIAIGQNAGTGISGTITKSIAIGSGAIANATNAIGIGSGVSAANSASIAIGSASASNATNAIAFGTETTAAQDNSIAIGTGVTVTNFEGIAIGSTSFVGGPNAATTNGLAGIAIGGSDGVSNGAFANSDYSIAIGVGATSRGQDSIALGTNASAGQTNSIAIGFNANSPQPNTCIIGNSTTSTFSVGIGTDTPTAKLTVSGTGFSGLTPLRLIGLPTGNNTVLTVDASGNVYQAISSRQYKENFRTIDPYSQKLYSLNPVVFDYKKQYNGNEDGRLDQFGLIAEEVEPHLPELIIYDDAGNANSVRYLNIIALLINEAQNHQQQLDEQKNINKQLINRIEQLESIMQVLNK